MSYLLLAVAVEGIFRSLWIGERPQSPGGPGENDVAVQPSWRGHTKRRKIVVGDTHASILASFKRAREANG